MHGAGVTTTFQDWNETQPGFLEADLVAHCGIQAEGNAYEEKSKKKSFFDRFFVDFTLSQGTFFGLYFTIFHMVSRCDGEIGDTGG